MITLPADIGKVTGWDGKSGEYDNLESAMTFAEHQAIVVRAGGLLASYSDDAFEGADDEDQVQAAYRDLKACYTSTTSPHALYIAKGIHQRHSDPHLQLVLAVPGSDKQRTFHLRVTTSRTGMALGTGYEQKFVWAPVQFSWSSATTHYFWPLNKVATATRPRGQSMSLDAHVARAALIDHDTKYSAFLEQLKALGFVKTADRQKLFTGTTVPIKVKVKQTTVSYVPATKKFTVA